MATVTSEQVAREANRLSKAAQACRQNMIECIKPEDLRLDEAAKWAAVTTAFNTSIMVIQNALAAGDME